MPPAFNLSQDQTLEFNLALLRCSKFDSRLAAQDSLRMRAKAHIRRQSQLSKSPSPRLGRKAAASATKFKLYTPRTWRQAPNRINFQTRNHRPGTCFPARNPARRPARRSGKRALSSTKEKKQGGGAKKKSTSLSLRYFSSEGGIPPMRFSKRKRCGRHACCLRAFLSSNVRASNKRSGADAAFRRKKQWEAFKGRCVQTRSRIKAQAPAQTALLRQVEKASPGRCIRSPQTLFAPFSHQSARNAN